jgi:hypothetical protein
LAVLIVALMIFRREGYKLMLRDLHNLSRSASRGAGRGEPWSGRVQQGRDECEVKNEFN